MARPTKLTPAIQQRVVSSIAAGAPLATACAYAGVDYSTFRRWLLRGKKERRGQYRDFWDAVEAAEARLEVRVVAEWQKHLPKKWEACRDFLARRFPERWSDSGKLQVAFHSEFDKMLADLERRLPLEVFSQVLDAIEQSVLEGDGDPAPNGAAKERPDLM